MQRDVFSKWQTMYPSLFVMLGPDVMSSGVNGANLAQFRINAGGLSFPLLRDCADGSVLADTNLIKPYNQRDNYVVIDTHGVIRYHADDFWDYGLRLHIDELDAALYGAISEVLDVPPSRDEALSVRIAPNPSSGRIVFTLAHTSGPSRVRILDLAGRQLALLDSGSAGTSDGPLVWDGSASDGHRVAAGLYLARVESAGRTLTRRIVLTR